MTEVALPRPGDGGNAERVVQRVGEVNSIATALVVQRDGKLVA
jgi:hypothetical protein